MLQREETMVHRLFDGLHNIPDVHILADNIQERLGIFSIYVHNVHFNLLVRLLNDRYGIQARGGCSCAGTYGHFLLHVDSQRSKTMTDKIDQGDLSAKLGWVRLSVHPTMTDEEVDFILQAIRDIQQYGKQWQDDYEYNPQTNEFTHKQQQGLVEKMVERWFEA